VIRLEDLRLEHWYYGPGRGGAFRLTHLPSGLAVLRDCTPDTVTAQCCQEMLRELEGKLAMHEQSAGEQEGP
jgi:hypothetical protein